MKMIQYANLHFENDAKVEVDRISVANETYISIRTTHKNVSWHIEDDEVESWLGQWTKLWSSAYAYNDKYLNPSFTVFVPRVLFEELRGKVLDHVAYTEEVKA